MLKKLSLSPDDAQDDSAEQNSEGRMLRALEALSSQPGSQVPPELDDQPFIEPREGAPFRPFKPAGAREPFRADAAHHVPKARHRFVRDGEVPVVHMSAARPAGAAGRSDADWAKLQQNHDELKLRAEHAERGRAEAQMQVKALQTKVAHAELALTEAQTTVQNRNDEIQALRAEIARLQSSPPPPSAPTPSALPLTAPDGVVKRGPGRPRKIVAEPVTVSGDPQPVEWWLMPSKAKRRS